MDLDLFENEVSPEKSYTFNRKIMINHHSDGVTIFSDKPMLQRGTHFEIKITARHHVQRAASLHPGCVFIQTYNSYLNQYTTCERDTNVH